MEGKRAHAPGACETKTRSQAFDAIKIARRVASESWAGESFIGEITRQWERERPDLDLRDFLLAIYLRRLGRLIENEYDRMCQARFGMSAWDMRVLLALRRGGPPHTMRPTDLFEALLVTSGAVTKQVDRLERRRLVKRRPDPDYGGGFQVQLTKRGLEMVDAAVELLARLIHQNPRRRSSICGNARRVPVSA
jgi:DNA-binding MarR family transcriptional regulator